ncbi:unnamed protein product [Oppiella nova]|uniref:Uncharacterized protein n=1 Tax=Oppiella nova TaxID=334625 RepID=A0A7R9LG74_9ACAR|nr:unnamed protein product [Oppiella nova]CAG2163357.1 unnamed protein product [Oppiella nova]
MFDITMSRTEPNVKTLIHYVKGLNGFTGMCPEDQFILARGAYPELNFMRCLILEQQLYIYLLQRYLLMKYGLEWESRLQKLMITLRDLQVMIEFLRIYSRDKNKHYLPNYASILIQGLN